jgi:hypothetical protein
MTGYIGTIGAQPSKSDIEAYTRSKQLNRVILENAEPTEIMPILGKTINLHSDMRDEWWKSGLYSK